MAGRQVTLWRDPDRRRAVMLSALVHALLFLLIYLIPWPQTQPTPAFIVIDVGTPALAEVPVDAPTVGDPAPQAPVPQVADPQTGEPQATTVEVPTPTRQPEPRTEAPQPDQAEVAAPMEVSPSPSAPQVLAPAPTASVPPVDIPLTEAPPRTALPEIDEVRLEPRPLPQAIVLPTPVVTAVVPEARVITATPSVQVTPERALPQPEVQVAVAEVRQLSATPQVEVAAERRVEVTPQVQVAEARPLAVTPQVEVAAAVAVPSPAVAVEVRLPAAAEAVVEEPVVEAPPGQEAIAAAQQPGGAQETAVSQAVSPRELNRPAGGNADQAGQTRDEAAARLEGLGAAASPAGAVTPTGVPASRVLEPFADQRFRPLAVVVDNANGFPQSGFLEASAIYEFPIEGGLTRLMMIYDRLDPASVGPVRSARDYMVAAARSLDGILVHDGGAPSAMHAITNENVTTFNAFNRGELFSRAGGRAPYNLYSNGNSLRQAINTLRLEHVRNLRTQLYRPAEDATATTAVQVRFSGAYSGGFSFNPTLNHYRWQRNGQNASDAGGQSIVVETVLIAHITAQPIPGDPYGRLFMRLQGGGEATLLIRGKRLEGRWNEQNGVSFFTNDGEQIDLAPFKHWVMFVPSWAQVTIE